MDDMEPRKCRFCDMSWAILGFAVGVVLIYMSLDLFTDGGVTKLWSPVSEDVEE